MRLVTAFLFFSSILWSDTVFAQSFYETIMTQNMANADSSNDVNILERSAMALERLAHNYSQDPLAIYHASICHIRIADLTVKKDTATAAKKLRQGLSTLKRADTAAIILRHARILKVYGEIVKNRIRTNSKGNSELEKQILNLRKEYPEDPRLCLLQAYHCRLLQNASKPSGKNCEKTLLEANGLFEKEVANGYEPRWGKKWLGELQKSKLKKASTK